MSRVSTHGLGVMCEVCKTVLVDDDCCKGEPHGYGYQTPNQWAARTWPDHECFRSVQETDQ